MKKAFTKLKTFALIVVMTLSATSLLKAQQPCTTGTTNAGTINAPTNSTPVTLNNAAGCNNYIILNNLVPGQQYEVSNQMGYAMALVDMNGNLVTSTSSSTLTFYTPNGVSSVRIVIYIHDKPTCNCGTAWGSGPLTIKCTYCTTPPPTGTNSSCRGGTNSNITLAMSNPAWMGQEYFNGVPENTYSQVTGIVANKSYSIFISGCNSNKSYFIVITKGSNQNGTTVVSGYAPLTFVAPTTENNSNEKYYMHLFPSSACGGNNGNISCGRLSFGLTSPLSVEITSFTGIATEQGNLLSWSTDSETNNDYFIVEASEDGINYSEIGRVKGAGTTRIQQDYSILDENPAEKYTYYRLKQIDYDGTPHEHDIIVVDRSNNNQLLVAPNPFSDELRININVTEKGYYQFEIVNQLGQKQIKENFLDKGYNTTQVDTKEFASGFYTFRIIDPSGVAISTSKLIKK